MVARRSPLPTTVIDKVKAFLTKTGARRARPFVRKVQIRDGVHATTDTVREMTRLAAKGAHDVLVRLYTVDAIDEMGQRMGRPIQGRDHRGIAIALYYWLQDRGAGDRSGMKFLNDSYRAEVLFDPALVLGAFGSGDCDDFTITLAAMLMSVGVPCFIRTTKVDARRPDLFSHVYLVADLKDGELPLDASVGFSKPGSQPTSTYGYKDWPIPFKIESDY